MAAAQRPYAAAAFAGTPSGSLAWKTLPQASHVLFVSQPDAATQLILQAVEATCSRSSPQRSPTYTSDVPASARTKLAERDLKH
jgi:hypothetical protein